MQTINKEIIENNYIEEYTSNRKIDSFTVAAPKINLLSYELWKYNWSAVNITGSYTAHHNFVHYDFHTLEAKAARVLFAINNIYNICELKKGTYTISFEVFNVSGDYVFKDISCSIQYVKYGEINVEKLFIGYFKAENGIQNFTFNIEDDKCLFLNIYIAHDFLANNGTSRDLAFDFMFLGLTPGEEPLVRSQTSFSTKPNILMSSSKNIIGEYQISNDIRRHLNQTERHILNCQNIFNTDTMIQMKNI